MKRLMGDLKNTIDFMDTIATTVMGVVHRCHYPTLGSGSGGTNRGTKR